MTHRYLRLPKLRRRTRWRATPSRPKKVSAGRWRRRSAAGDASAESGHPLGSPIPGTPGSRDALCGVLTYRVGAARFALTLLYMYPGSQRMRILKYEHERRIAERAAIKSTRVAKLPVPSQPKEPPRDGGKRHYVATSTEFYTSEQPLSVSGQKWDRKRKVQDGTGRFKAQFSCNETSEFGDMGTIRHYTDECGTAHKLSYCHCCCRSFVVVVCRRCCRCRCCRLFVLFVLFVLI